MFYFILFYYYYLKNFYFIDSQDFFGRTKNGHF